MRRGVAFRDAHEISGGLVSYCEQAGVDLTGLSDDQLAAVDERLTPDVRGVLSVDGALQARAAVGGTSPDRVAEQLAGLEELIGRQSSWAAAHVDQPGGA